jgi:hypothetical protein
MQVHYNEFTENWHRFVHISRLFRDCSIQTSKRAIYVVKKRRKKKKDDHQSTQRYGFLPRGAHRESSRLWLIQNCGLG